MTAFGGGSGRGLHVTASGGGSGRGLHVAACGGGRGRGLHVTAVFVKMVIASLSYLKFDLEASVEVGGYM